MDRLSASRETFLEQRLHRRKLLKLATKCAAATGLSVSWHRALEAAPAALHFDGWGGAGARTFEKYAFRPFEGATGIRINQRSFSEEDSVIKNVEKSNPGEFHLIHSFGLHNYQKYLQIGRASEINEANIPNLAKVVPAMINPLRKLNPKLSGIPFSYGTTGIAYNKKFVSDEEAQRKGAMLLIDSQYSGRISQYDDMLTRMWFAALQTGQDPNAISDLNAVWAKMREGRSVIKRYWRTGVELMELLLREEVVVADAWSGRIAALQQQGHPIGYFDPIGGLAWMENIILVKGAPQPECEQLFNYLLDPAVSVAFAEMQSYPPSLDPTKVSLPNKIVKLAGFDKTGTLSGLKFEDPIYWAQNAAAWRKQWMLISQGL